MSTDTYGEGLQNIHTDRVALPFCHCRLRAKKPLPASYPRSTETQGDRLKRRRLDLGLSGKVAAQRLGVCAETLKNWESGRTRPVIHHLPTIRRFLGESVEPIDDLPLGARFRACRARFGYSQWELAQRLGIDESTVASWENGEHRPSRLKARQVRWRIKQLCSEDEDG